MDEQSCRACAGRVGNLVLDLGEQPACDYFPGRDVTGPDPAYPLQMWLCSRCGLAQLVGDPTVPEEPRGTEPAALKAQAVDAVDKVVAAGLLPRGGRVTEYGSPHGGSWLGLLKGCGLTSAGASDPADVIVDCFGMMHAPDQSSALAERVARLASGGVLLLQYHSLDTIVRCGQWNALRHGHYAYYSTTAMAAMLAANEFSPFAAWEFDLYGGTVLLAARRDADGLAKPDDAVRSLLARDDAVGVRHADVLTSLQTRARLHARSLREWLVAERSAGRTIVGYGAASRAVALLRLAEADRTLLHAVIDASPAKAGLRMPGTDVPIFSPAELARRRPDAVLLFVADLREEVRAAFPHVEAAGGRWIDADSLDSFLVRGSGGL
ncbi:MAG TPA: methyltransferase C-terminal domain-containing protein [Streptosporangiaceae bacterium]